MKRIEKSVLLVIIVLLGSFTIENQTKTTNYIGSAFDMKTNKAIYTEFHEEQYKGGKHISTITNYKDASGKLIAKRNLNFEDSQERPVYKFEVIKNGYYEGVEANDKSIHMYHLDIPENKLHEKNVTIPQPYVIDGGFNYFIKSHWDDMMNGKNVVFNFVVPARLDFYKFRIRKICNVDFQGKKAVVVNLESDSFILRALIDPIVITYDIASKRILKYEGISNIAKDARRNYDAKLIYPTLGP